MVDIYSFAREAAALINADMPIVIEITPTKLDAVAAHVADYVHSKKNPLSLDSNILTAGAAAYWVWSICPARLVSVKDKNHKNFDDKTANALLAAFIGYIICFKKGDSQITSSIDSDIVNLSLAILYYNHYLESFIVFFMLLKKQHLNKPAIS